MPRSQRMPVTTGIVCRGKPLRVARCRKAVVSLRSRCQNKTLPCAEKGTLRRCVATAAVTTNPPHASYAGRRSVRKAKAPGTNGRGSKAAAAQELHSCRSEGRRRKRDTFFGCRFFRRASLAGNDSARSFYARAGVAAHSAPAAQRSAAHEPPECQRCWLPPAGSMPAAIITLLPLLPPGMPCLPDASAMLARRASARAQQRYATSQRMLPRQRVITPVAVMPLLATFHVTLFHQRRRLPVACPHCAASMPYARYRTPAR